MLLLLLEDLGRRLASTFAYILLIGCEDNS